MAYIFLLTILLHGLVDILMWRKVFKDISPIRIYMNSYVPI